MDKDKQARLAAWKLRDIERAWREAKADGTETDDLRRRLSDARSHYRARWRRPAPNSVQPAATSLDFGVNSPGG